jgi:hypothetical protein
VSEIESVDRPMPIEDSRTWRVLLTRLHWDDEGNPESFVFVYATKRASSHGEYLGGVRTRHESRKTKPFLGGWRGAMSHWATYNVDALKKSLAGHRHEFSRSTRWRPMIDYVLVTPGPPARPELPSLVLHSLERSPDPQSPLLSVP